MNNDANNSQAIENGKQVTVETKTRAEAVEKVKALRQEAKEKGLEATGGFIVFDYEKEGDMPYSATLIFTDPSNI